jgi:hypothetical protein
MVPLTFFFHKIRNKKATKRQRLLIEQWMYCTAYNYRYSSGAESKIIEDLDRMARIASDQEETSYPGQEMRVDPMYLTTWNFSASDACCKLILCLFAYNEPKSFDSNGLVNLDNSNLKIATSRNFHHFFPKAHLKKHQKDASANLIANITLVDGYSNKHKIRDKAPSAYISKFEKENDEINETMKSHLITDVEKFGIYDDNYDVFIKMRCREIARQINRKLNPFGQKEGAPDNALEAAG